jgi:hypothetical protein
MLLHVSVVRPSSRRKYNILIPRVTQLTTDPLFYNIANLYYVATCFGRTTIIRQKIY